jgi:hypothetical protein
MRRVGRQIDDLRIHVGASSLRNFEKEVTMSWTSGHFTLDPGQTGYYQFGWGDDHGAQMAVAREFSGSTGGNPLSVTDLALVRESDNSIDYWVNVNNGGQQTATFELVGGGLT